MTGCLYMFFKKQPDQETLEIGGWRFQVTYKPIRHIYLRIHPREGKLRISAPIGLPQKEIQRFVQAKSGWIEKKLNQLRTQKTNAEPEYSYTNGEQIPVWGTLVEIQLTRGGSATKAHFGAGKLLLNIRGKDTLQKRKQAVEEWYRAELKREIPLLINKWEPIMGVKVQEFGVKNMKTRWGTCNMRDRRIWLNLRLAQYPQRLLELVVVHEMVHLLERGHNKRFYGFMNRFLPDWKARSKELNGRVC